MKLHILKNKHPLNLLILLLTAGLLYGCVRDDILHPPAPEENADVVYDWYKLAIRTQLHTNPPPVVITNNRNFGYIGVGLYEAVRPGIKGSVSISTILYQMPSIPEPARHQEYLWGASANAALASMFRQFLVNLTDANRASIDSLENAYNNRFRQSTSDAVVSRSQAYGRAVAAIMYSWSTSDNFNLAATGYTLPTGPSAWVPTPPANAAPVGPFLMNSRPFLEYSLTALAPPPPVPYSEDPSSGFYKEAKDVYDIGKTLTNEQKAIANFWADVGGVGVGVPPPSHILSMVTGVLEKKKAKLGQAAEVYAKTGIAHKDAFINTWRAKFTYNLLRPITYINRHIDPAWMSYLPNPPYPDYPSGLSGIVTPVMQILIREFGDIPVTDRTYSNNVRHFNSISALIEEAAISRFYAGIHYRFTMNATVKQGKEFGNRIADIDLSKGWKH